MANSEKSITVLPCPQTAPSGSPAAEPAGLCKAPSSGDSPTPMLDRLVGELEASFGAALTNRASAPAHAQAEFPTNRSSGSGEDHERSPRRQATEGGVHPDKSTFEAVLNGKEWSVSLPGNDANAEAQGCRTGEVDRADAAAQSAATAPWREWLLSGRYGRRLLRQVSVPGALLIPLGLGAMVLALITPPSLPTAVETGDEPKSDGFTAGIGDEPADELGRVTIEQRVEPEALAEVQEPVTPRLVKTVRIHEELDQAGQAPAPPAPASVVEPHKAAPDQRESGEIAEAANAASAEPLQASPRAPVRTEEALSEMEPGAVVSDRWPSVINVENEAQPRELIAAEDRARDAEPVEDPAETEEGLIPVPRPALASAATEADESSSSTDRSAKPTRFAATTSDVNMRAGPTSRAAVVTVVPAGKRVGVIGCDSWCEVVFGEERGWIYSSFVSGVKSRRHAGAAAADLSIAPGTPLIGADGAPIGTVRGRSTNDAGQVFFLVELADELGAPVPSVWLRKEHFVAADEQARLKFTRARLLRSLPSQSDAEAGRDTNAS